MPTSEVLLYSNTSKPPTTLQGTHQALCRQSRQRCRSDIEISETLKKHFTMDGFHTLNSPKQTHKHNHLHTLAHKFTRKYTHTALKAQQAAGKTCLCHMASEQYLLTLAVAVLLEVIEPAASKHLMFYYWDFQRTERRRVKWERKDQGKYGSKLTRNHQDRIYCSENNIKNVT